MIRELEAGEHIIRITVIGAGFSLDKIDFKCTVPTDIHSITSDQQHNIRSNTYNLMGVKVDGNYKGIIIHDGKKVLVK